MNMQDAIDNLLLKVTSSKSDDAVAYTVAILNLVEAQKMVNTFELKITNNVK